MEHELKDLITKYALQNALKYGGKCSPGAVIGKIFAEKPELKENAKDLGKEVAKVVAEVNKLGIEKQQKKLEETYPELLYKI